MRPVDLFHIGPQKAGTTWVYACLREHPDVVLPSRDSIHYFDIGYHRGRDWYAGHFPDHSPGRVLIDPTPSYLRCPNAPARIAKENPKAKIIVCLRHPIERAFSHYWHEKKKHRFNFRFEEVLENYDLWSNWVESGFYSRFLQRYLDHFPREQILCQLFDDLSLDTRAFLDAILEFGGLERGFTPSVLDVKVNPALASETQAKVEARKLLASVGLIGTAIKVKGALRSVGLVGDADRSSGGERIERLIDVDPAVRAELRLACTPEIERVERLMGVDLSTWRRDE
jgi:hypothetical protein